MSPFNLVASRYKTGTMEMDENVTYHYFDALAVLENATIQTVKVFHTLVP